MERQRRKKDRKCLSLDETILEDLIHQESLNKQFKFLSTNRSMNSLPSVNEQRLLNFLCKQNVSVKTSELCKIAREISFSQTDDLSLNLAEKKRVKEGPKYHSWPKHSNQNEKHQVKYHNYGLLEEHDIDSTEDLFETGKNTQRSWTSPSELNVVEPSIYQSHLESTNFKQKTVSCPCLVNINKSWRGKTNLNSSISMIDLKKLSQFDDRTTENLDGIINNNFKEKFVISNKAPLLIEEDRSDSSVPKHRVTADFDHAYNSMFEHNVLDLIEEENKIKNFSTQQQFKHSSVESSLFSSHTGKMVGNSSLSLYNEESSDSDSGVGQFSYLLPALKNFDIGVEPAIFKERADVSLCSNLLNFFNCIL